ncbi:MAG: hypothetical protein LQ346_006319 [Caloplaca aetnensis]|nr:MAG: hypothetical protein LQ346_006319 [Caloplaca aetnensis]
MSPINATANVVNSILPDNTTILFPLHPSEEWQDSPYVLYVIRAMILGGGNDDVSAAAGEHEFSDLSPTNTEMTNLDITHTVDGGSAWRSDTLRTATEHLHDHGQSDSQRVGLVMEDELNEVLKIQQVRAEKRAQTI